MIHDAACEREAFEHVDGTQGISACHCAERALAQADAALLALVACVDSDDHWYNRIPFLDFHEEYDAAIAAARQRQEGRG